MLGRGNFVTVYSAVELPTGRTVALKVVDRYRAGKLKKTNDLIMEKHCLLRMNHPNIIKMYAHFTDTLNVWVVLEACLHGEMWDEVKTIGCADPLARFYLAQVLNAMHYLRQARIVHRDLKCENLMLCGGGVIKLIDFGTAKDLENPHIKGSGNAARKKVFEDYVGTAQFMPEEVIHNKCSDFRSDIWSLGCTIYQMLIGCPPYHAASEYLVFCKIMESKLEWPPGVSPNAKDLVCRMCVKNADDRLGAHDIEQLRSHAYFEGVVFKDAHKQAPPVPTLADLCLKAFGRRIKILMPIYDGWCKREELDKPLADVIERMRLSQKWQDDALPPDADC